MDDLNALAVAVDDAGPSFVKDFLAWSRRLPRRAPPGAGESPATLRLTLGKADDRLPADFMEWAGAEWLVGVMRDLPGPGEAPRRSR